MQYSVTDVVNEKIEDINVEIYTAIQNVIAYIITEDEKAIQQANNDTINSIKNNLSKF
ncbi:MAG: hypothetical protein RSA29_13550 [Clostridium sp.]|uniref:hypothetical protein n=1 Tax=Clostridium sp. TaxID=1506 RepID=UPI003031116B